MWPCTVGHKVWKAPRVAERRGTTRLRRQHLSLWHKAGATCTRMTSFGHKKQILWAVRIWPPAPVLCGRLCWSPGWSRWPMIPTLTFWHSPFVAVYPPGTFACISILLMRVVLAFYQNTSYSTISTDWCPLVVAQIKASHRFEKRWTAKATVFSETSVNRENYVFKIQKVWKEICGRTWLTYIKINMMKNIVGGE